MPPNERSETQAALEWSAAASPSGDGGHAVSDELLSPTVTTEGNHPTSAITLSHVNEGLEPCPTPQTEPIPKARRRRVRLGEALRNQGIDEQALAERYADVMDDLKDKPKDSNVGKLLVDVLKQCSKILEEDSQKLGARTDSIPVVLVHKVSRPRRDPGSGGDKSGSES